MDKHITMKLKTLDINDKQVVNDDGITNVVNDKVVELDTPKKTEWGTQDPYYEVLWLTGC